MRPGTELSQFLKVSYLLLYIVNKFNSDFDEVSCFKTKFHRFK